MKSVQLIFLSFLLAFWYSLAAASSIPTDGFKLLQERAAIDEFDFRISSVHKLICNKQINCTDVIDYFLERALRYNKMLNALITVNAAQAKQQALEQDESFKSTNALVGKLHCIPILVKDNIDVAGLPTTGGIKALRYSIPNEDALVIARLRKEGAIVIGKTNLAELATGSENSETGGLCRNPFDLRRSCGPSSTGVGASVSAAFGLIGIGTDTDSSIITPSTYCGLFGIRPQQYSLPMDGIIPLFDKQDVVGPMTKHIDDMVLAYSIMANNASIYDQYSTDSERKTPRIGIITNFIDSFEVVSQIANVSYVVDSGIKSVFDQEISRLKSSKSVAIFEYSFTNEELLQNNNLFSTLIYSSGPCLLGCVKSSFNRYFSRDKCFDVDAPYQNFDELAKSSLLSSFWTDTFNDSLNIVGNEDATEKCRSLCKTYDELKNKFIPVLSSWFEKDNIDSIVIPSSAILSPLHNEPVLTIRSLMILAPASGFSSLNIPIGYTNPTSMSPDGLPVGLLLINKPGNSLSSAFKTAKIIESSRRLDKLPYSTPPLANRLTGCESGNSATSVYSFSNQTLLGLIIVFSIQTYAAFV